MRWCCERCTTSDLQQFKSRNCPQCFGTGPNDQGGTRHGGSAAWESVSCQIRGESVGWWSNFILSPRKTGGFFRGARHVTSPSRQSGADKSSRPITGTGARHVTSWPPDRGSTHHVVAAYQGTMYSLRISVGKFLPSPIQSVPVPSTRFFFLFDYRLRHCAHFDTSPPGAFGRNGFHGEST